MFFVALVNNAIDIVSWIIYLECIITWVSGIVSSLESHCVHSTRTYKMTSMLGRGVTSGPEGCRAGDVLLLWRRWMWFKDYLFNIGFICICQQKGTERPERGGDGLWGLAWQRWRWQILTGEIWIPLMQEAHTHKHTRKHTHTHITSFQYKFIPFFYSRFSHASQQRLTRLKLLRCTKERCWLVFSSSTFCL